MSKHKKNEAAKKRHEKKARAEQKRRELRAAKSHAFKNPGSRKAKAKARQSEARRRKVEANARRVKAQVEGKPMKELKKLAKAAGLTGYSNWTSAQRGEAEACIIEAMLSRG
jgi:hypothetical protein